MKKIILDIVNSKSGIRAVNLVLDVMTEVNPQLWKPSKFDQNLRELIKSGDIIELEYIEYIDPDTSYLKSMFFKKGTRFERTKP